MAPKRGPVWKWNAGQILGVGPAKGNRNGSSQYVLRLYSYNIGEERLSNNVLAGFESQVMI